MAKKIYIQQSHPELSVVNTDTGEIISGVATTKVENIDEFIMIFLLNIQDAFKLEGQHLKILMCCWKYSSFNPSAPLNAFLPICYNEPKLIFSIFFI